MKRRAQFFRGVLRAADLSVASLSSTRLLVSLRSRSSSKFLVVFVVVIAVSTLVASHALRPNALNKPVTTAKRKAEQPSPNAGNWEPGFAAPTANSLPQGNQNGYAGSGASIAFQNLGPGNGSAGQGLSITFDTTGGAEGSATNGVSIGFQNAVANQATGQGLSVAFQNSTSGASNSLGQGISIVFEAPSTVHSISGQVKDESAIAIAGVSLTLSGSSSGTTSTDSAGNYSFSSLPAGGSYTVTPLSNSYSFGPASQTFNNLSVDRIANFVGTRSVVSIVGQVMDSNNTGVNNVTIALTRNGAPAGTALTDGFGNYRFHNLSTGANYVVTPVGSFVPSSQFFNNLSTDAAANFRATPGIPAQCNTTSFGSEVNFAAGTAPRAIAVGDFNNDGILDLAVATDTNNVLVRFGDGAGNFATTASFAVGTTPNSVTVGDFNRDGNSDLAVANFGSNNISVLLGNGSGSFAAATSFAAGTNPSTVMFADFNGDGELDLAVANFGSNNVSVLLGDGAAGFGGATNFAVGSGPRGLAVSDFNGDGKPDLVTANQNSNNFSMLQGNGDGSFGAAINFAAAASPFSVVVGDFNSDGKTDLLGVNQASNSVSLLLGTGAGSFGAATNFAVGTGPVSVALGDFNGDGKLDLAVANSAGTNVSVLLGNGTGTFTTATNFLVGSIPVALGVGDFDGDGKFDLAVVNNNANNASVLLNNGPVCKTSTGISISGRVANANQSVADVTLTLSGPITRVIQTDVNGNYLFSNLPPGGNYTVALQSNSFVFAPTRVDLFNLSISQTFDFSAAPLAVPVPTPPANDDFSGQTRDANKWSLGLATQAAAAFDAQVNVSQVNSQLVIVPISQSSGMHYGGYVSANAFDMRNGSAGVEVVKAGTGGVDTIFSVGSDSDNFYRFMVHTPGSTTSLAQMITREDGSEGPLDITTAQLIFQVRVGGQLTSLSINYDMVAHRYMRFRHEAPSNSIVFETSPNNIDFTVQHRVTLQRSVAALTAELSAGTSSPANPGPTVFDAFVLVTSTFQFSAGSYTVGEGDGSVLITVTRTGSTADAASVGYATTDGTAAQTNKYITAVGTLSFAPVQASRTFSVLIVDNALTEGNQALNLFLSNPVGSGLNIPARAVLTITDNDTTVATSNPLDVAQFYVQQHYYDFLNRVPDAPGLAFWIDQIRSCGTDMQCIEIRRINVSAAYFLSIEFQETGFLVHRFYNLALNRPNGLPRYLEFFRDTQAIGNGVIVGADGWEALLEANRVSYASEFATRAEFTALYPLTLSGAEYVDALYAHAGITPSAAERQAAINEFSNPTGARGRVLRRVAENQMLSNREFNRAFVLAQYFGYLRRNPDDAPDNNLDGYNFWLNKLNEFNGNFVNAEMVKAFITSGEYRQRFGP